MFSWYKTSSYLKRDYSPLAAHNILEVRTAKEMTWHKRKNEQSRHLKTCLLYSHNTDRLMITNGMSELTIQFLMTLKNIQFKTSVQQHTATNQMRTELYHCTVTKY